MSITIGSQKRSITKIKAQYIAAACGIALAASAIVAIASWPGDSGDKAGAGFTPLISAASSQSANAQPWVYFVVGSQDEAFQLEGMLASDSYAQETPVTSHILVVNTIEQEMQLVATVEELMIAGVDFQLADLRSQPPAPVMPAAA